MNNKSVINAFICGKSAKSSNGKLYSNGEKLYSYYTVIGQRLADGTIILNRTKYSVSTSKIQTWLLYSVIESGLQYKEVCNVPLGGYRLERYL